MSNLQNAERVEIVELLLDKNKENKMSKVYLLNTRIVALKNDSGTVKVSPLLVEDVKSIIALAGDSFVSAVGHAGTAEALTTLLEMPILANRMTIALSLGDIQICMSFKERLPEGKVLTKEELLGLNPTFCRMEVIG